MAESMIWDTEYSAVAPSARSLKDYVDGGPVGLVLREAVTDDNGETTAVKATVVTPDGQTENITINVKRVLRQLSLLAKAGTDRAIVSVAAYGRRGYVLAPPPAKADVKGLKAATDKA